MKIYISMALILAILVISVSGCVENNTNESVVHILCKIGNSDENCGTGFVIRDDGYILTVFHVVVNDGLDIRTNNMKDDFTIVLTNGKKLKIVNSFNISENLFIIKVDATLKPVKFYDNDSNNINSSVIIFGYINTSGKYVFSNGTIAYRMSFNTTELGTIRPVNDEYIINTYIQRGYSGGPVFLNNSVIGIANNALTDNVPMLNAKIGWAVAIPVNSSILEKLP